jgi:uncharacterized damage-inducible protein DinB
MNDTVLRDQLINLLESRNAHMSFHDAVSDFPQDHINSLAPAFPYSVWNLIEHMRIAQRDIIDFIENVNYVELKWPDDYWPAEGQEANTETWMRTVKEFQDDLGTLKEIVANPNTDLMEPLSHAPTYNTLREILLVADHNSYHIGQIISLKRILKIF